ncbi:ABC transporter permease subunit [Dactylosporangium cerinum]
MAWRQFRVQFQALGAVVLLLLAALALTASHIVDLREVSNSAETFLSQVRRGYAANLYLAGSAVLMLPPVIVGVFWGAPLVARELETGTHRLAWNQSITRTRWFAVRLGGVALATAVLAGAATVAFGWWASPIDAVALDRLQPVNFGARGIVPVGYALFALAVGITAGLLLRRTIPAMAVTVAVVAAVQVLLPFGLRQQLIPPVHTTVALDMENLAEMGMTSDGEVRVVGNFEFPGAWMISNETVKPDGTPFVRLDDPTPCTRAADTPKACEAAVGALNLQQSVVYQPPNRFWPLQLAETGLLLAVAGLLTLLSFWWLRRRVT